MTYEKEILLAASRGNISRFREGERWTYWMNRKRISRAPVLALMRRGLLEAGGSKVGPPFEQGVMITVKGREALR